ncbi:hypothetical protein GZH47_31745 (plasmid) [Paenibacillus rhizovicinus]|uniref:Uncharacterized protein n=1 Tax=Paenibacillus rhizovicinus TaxID=2704463 RepID=A0A6C0PAR8_9BACL|nr:hypothetical protein [Paenibacillus rhizovicinus]QHW35471.1 hypothetical protein GZH47_31745 [Paenibacillus rhizovicinus]
MRSVQLELFDWNGMMNKEAVSVNDYYCEFQPYRVISVTLLATKAISKRNEAFGSSRLKENSVIAIGAGKGFRIKHAGKVYSSFSRDCGA